MTIHFVEDYQELTGETVTAATKRFQAETKVVKKANEEAEEPTSTDKAETK